MALIQFPGLASGIDTGALIDALIEQQRAARIVPYENQITSLQETNSAFEELSTLLDNLKGTVEGFRAVNGGALSRSASSSDETVLSASASNAANTGVYDITVSQLASNATFSFDDRFTDGSDAINSSINDGAAEADRTVSYTIGSGASSESVDIVMTSDMTASDFVQEFNSQSSQATASLVNVGTESSPSYAIVINSNYEGTEQGSITLDSVGTEIQTAGSGAFTGNQLDQANNLQFNISGISGTIERSSNTVSDVIPGLSFTANDTGSLTLTISTDQSETEANVQAFVDAYNELYAFIGENDATLQDESGGEVTNIIGPLGSTSLDESIITSLRSAFSSAGISGGTVNVLSDLGITTQRDGTLAFDTDKFADALNDDSVSVGTILQNLGEELGGVDGTIAQYTRFNGLIDQAVQSNDNQVDSLNNRIADLEANLTKQEQSLTARFASLEAQISRLQNQQNSLLSLLPTA